MVKSVTTQWLLYYLKASLFTKYFSLDGPNTRSGYLNFNDSPLRLATGSPFLESGVIWNVCDALGFSGVYPLFSLESRQLPSGTEVYHTDLCSSCYDLYLECNHYPFRIDDTGDLRIYFKGVWSAFCGTNRKGAKQAGENFCSNLKLPSTNVTVIPASFGNYTHSWKMRDVCVKSGESLTTCKFIRSIIKDACEEDNLLAYRCEAKTPIVRLIDWGHGGHRGIVEIEYKENDFRPIGRCADLSMNDIDVLCRTLGLPSSDANLNFKYGYKAIVSGDFGCSGTEGTLKGCKEIQNEKTYSTCNSYYSIELMCDEAHEGKLRLTGGFDGVSGQLEIYHNNTWGRVCGTGFGQTEVNVACYQITNGTVREGRHAVVGQYSEIDFLLDGVKCQAGDTRLEDCVHNPWGEHTCSGADNVFISCSEAPKYRLDEKSGRLEVYHDSQWGAICSSNFGKDEARTACKTLGLPSALTKTSSVSSLPESGRMWLKDLTCGSTSEHLSTCQSSVWGMIGAETCDPVHLLCGDINKATDTIELKGPGSGELGRIFVRHMGGLGRVCMKNASVEVAKVACRSLGLPVENAVLLSDDLFGSATENYIFNGVSCEGTEASLFDCSYTSLNSQYCDHSRRRLSVACRNSSRPDYSLRLNSESDDIRSGTVEMRFNGLWGTLCGLNFEVSFANVACRELGFSGDQAEVVHKQRNYREDGEISLNFEGSCGGGEMSLQACGNITGINFCSGYQLAAIRCKPISTFKPSNIVGAIVGGVVSLVVVLIVVVVVVVICIVKRRSRPSATGQPLQTMGKREGSRPPQPAQYPVPGSTNPTYQDDHGFVVPISQPAYPYSYPAQNGFSYQQPTGYQFTNPHAMNQHAMSQHGMNQHGMNQHAMNQHEMSQHGMSQHGINQHAMNQRGMNQHEMNQHGRNQHGMDQNGRNQHGMNKHEMNQHGINKQGMNQHVMNQHEMTPHNISKQTTNWEAKPLEPMGVATLEEHSSDQECVV